MRRGKDSTRAQDGRRGSGRRANGRDAARGVSRAGQAGQRAPQGAGRGAQEQPEAGRTSGRAGSGLRPWHRWIQAPILAVGLAWYLLHALHFRFLQDDAFIFFRYARNLAEGHGLVWNIGERVEGYTSILWTLILAAAFLLGAHIETIVQVLTLSLGLGTLALAYLLAKRLAGTALAGCTTLLLLAADRTFAIWSTSGMDTRLFGFAALLVITAAWRLKQGNAGRRGWLHLGLAMVLLSLSRPEGIALSAVTLAFLWLGSAAGARRRSLLAAGAVWLFGVGGHLAFRRLYYGEWLPNTYFAKVDGLDLGQGGSYLREFAASFPVPTWIILLAVAWGMRGLFRLTFRSFLSLVVIAYLLYVLAVGGDFMEFRFLDVVLPVGYVLVSVFLADVASRWRGKVVRAGVVTIAGAVVLASAHASVHFEDSAHQVLTWSVMSRQSTDAWVAIGKWFGRIAAPQESIATGTCGAIPYYSGLRCLDMRGLNDKYVARLAPDRSQPAGHHKVAPLSYVRERNITYIIFPTRAFPLGYGPPLGPDEFLVEIEDTEGDYLGGRNFLLLIRAAKDRNSLVQSLRRRGVRVITDEPPAADQALPGR